MVTKNFDIIIAGAGLSGLSLAYRLALGNYAGSVAIVDVDFTPKNDKTWCFWSNVEAPFSEIISKQWHSVSLTALDFKATRDLTSYSYNAIKSEDFKTFVLKEIQKHPNFELIETSVKELSHQNNKCLLTTIKGEKYSAEYIFQSLFKDPRLETAKIKYPLIQHFVGLEVQVNNPAFDDTTIKFMDFDETWTDRVAFMYVLPFSKTTALLEYTIFSESIEEEHLYEERIHSYISKNYGLKPADYQRIRKEKGQIPMQDLPYTPWYAKNIMNLGLVGGLAKPSSGYAFMRIQHHVEKLANSLILGATPEPPTRSKRQFWIYDLLLLHILANSTEDSLQVFKSLFKNNSIEEVFRFLDEETNFYQDLKIMNSVPYLPFLKAIAHNLW